MSLPHLLSNIGAYFEALQIPNFCLGPGMTVEQEGLGPRIIFDPKQVPDCPVVLIIVSFTRRGFVEGQNYILIDRTRRELERINPLPDYFGYFSPTALMEAGLGGFRLSSIRPEDLPDDYFSSLYYLETRLMNPASTREQILQALQSLTPETIMNYRDRLLSFIPPATPNQNDGIILCSGRASLNDLHRTIPQGVQWTTVDTNIDSDPDIFGSYSSFPTLRQIGLFGWDYVYVRGCPIGLSLVEYQNAVRAARWLLKRGGRLYIPSYNPRSPRVASTDQKVSAVQDQIERIRQQEFFSHAQLDGRFAVFTV